MIHSLKVWPAYYEAIIDGRKAFEIRNNSDRGFQAGDIVTLRETLDKGIGFSGRELKVEITYVTNFAQKEGWVVFGFKAT